MRIVSAILAGLLLIVVAGFQVRGGDAEVRVERDLVYGKGGAVDLQLDLATPAQGKGPFPAVVCIHGGGWRGGSRQQLDGLIKVLAKRGFVAATVSYRLTDKAAFPAQIEDCKAAVRWLRANAEKYRIRADAVGAVGFSAGAHLASLLGTADKSAELEGQGGNADQSSRVQAVVSFFGPSDFTVKTWDKKVEDFFLVPFFGGTFEEKEGAVSQGLAARLRHARTIRPFCSSTAPRMPWSGSRIPRRWSRSFRMSAFPPGWSPSSMRATAGAAKSS